MAASAWAHNQLGQWEQAVAACTMALELSSGYQLARNNLNWALSGNASFKGYFPASGEVRRRGRVRE
jgi:hypothetical protein